VEAACSELRLEGCTRVVVLADDVMDSIRCIRCQTVDLIIGGRGCPSFFENCSVVNYRVNRVALAEEVTQKACAQLCVHAISPESARPLSAKELHAEECPDIRFGLSQVVTTTISKGIFTSHSEPSQRRRTLPGKPVEEFLAEDHEFPITVWAQYAYEAANTDELSFPAGAHLLLFGPASEEGWFEARSALSAERGIVPGTHIEKPIVETLRFNDRREKRAGAEPVFDLTHLGDISHEVWPIEVRARYDYEAAEGVNEELSFARGDRLTLLGRDASHGWFRARNAFPRQGIVPGTHVVREEDWAKENWEPRAAPLVASRFGRYKATFSYVAEHPDELDFNEGELMTLVQKAEDEGWIVARLDRGPEGLVPLTHLTGAGEEDPNAVIKPAAKPALKHAQTLPTATMEPSRTTQGPTLQHVMSVQLSQPPLQPAEAEAPPGSARGYPLVAADSLSPRMQQVVQPAPTGVSTASAAAPSTTSAIGARAPDPEQPTAVALFAYVAANADEMSFQAGDKLDILGPAVDSGWLRARLSRTGVEGVVPSTHVKVYSRPMGKYTLVAADSLSPRMQQVVQSAPTGVSTASAAAPSTTSAIGARAPDPEQPTAVALFAYVAANADEMSFQAGDKLDILGPAVDSGWLRARHVRTRVEAIVPMTHLEVPIRPCRRAQASNGCRACKHEP